VKRRCRETRKTNTRKKNGGATFDMHLSWLPLHENKKPGYLSSGSRLSVRLSSGPRLSATDCSVFAFADQGDNP